jgi:hypothetical protein
MGELAALKPGEILRRGDDVYTKQGQGIVIRESARRYIFKVVGADGNVRNLQIDHGNLLTEIPEKRAQGWLFIGALCTATAQDPCPQAVEADLAAGKITEREASVIMRRGAAKYSGGRCEFPHPFPAPIERLEHPELELYPLGLADPGLKKLMADRRTSAQTERDKQAQLQPDMQRARQLHIQARDLTRHADSQAQTASQTAQMAQLQAENTDLRAKLGELTDLVKSLVHAPEKKK